VSKIADGGFGTGESPLWILNHMVIFGLGVLGVPIEDGFGLTTRFLPLGLLLGVGWAIAWAARTTVAGSSAASRKECLKQGLKVAVPFAGLCLLAALIFRLRNGDELGADPGMALVMGAVWGALSGALGGLRAHSSIRDLASQALDQPGGGAPFLREGLVAGGTMLLASSVLAVGFVLVYIIVQLMTGSTVSLEAGDVVLLIFLLAAFGPNLVVGAVAFAVGAPIEFSTDLFGGGAEQVSLFGWGAVPPPAFSYVALIIPLLACLLAGYSARRSTADATKPLHVVGVAAATYAIVLTLLGWIGRVRIGQAGDLGGGALLEIGPRGATVFLLALLWAAAVGYVGWKVGESGEAGAAQTVRG
jgi:Family of unknown function (DUF6350)